MDEKSVKYVEWLLKRGLHVIIHASLFYVLKPIFSVKQPHYFNGFRDIDKSTRIHLNNKVFDFIKFISSNDSYDNVSLVFGVCSNPVHDSKTSIEIGQ